MHFEPSKELKQFIEACVKSGWYQNQSEVVRAPLRRMKVEEDKRSMLLKWPNSETVAAFKEVEEGKATTASYDEFKKEMANLVDD